MDNIKRIDDIMVGLFNTVLKMEESALKETGRTDLSAKEIGTLSVLDVKRSKTMSQVAAELRISTATLTVSINRLVKKGYVERHRGERDRRVVRLRLTEKGRQAVKVRELFHRRIIGEAVSELSADETERFIDSLESINSFLALRETPRMRKGEFSLSPIKIGERTVPKNLFQGALSPCISGAEMAAAAVNLGGVGTIPSNCIGIMGEGYEENPVEANKAALAREIRKARKLIGLPEGRWLKGRLTEGRENFESYGKSGSELEESVRGAGDKYQLDDRERHPFDGRERYHSDGEAAGLPAVEEAPQGKIETGENRNTKNERGVLAVNVVCADPAYREYVKTACEEGAEMIIAGAGIPAGLPEICGEDILLVPVVSSVRAIKVILKSWQKKYNRKPDAFIFEGPLAGGMLGYKRDQIGKALIEFYSVLKSAGELLREEGIPLIAAGGIWDKKDATRAYNYGADGVQLGSRFVTTEESRASEEFKKAYISCGKEDTVLVDMAGGQLGRVLKGEGDIAKAEGEDVFKYAAEATAGNIKGAVVFAGAKAYRAEKIETVKEIFDSFI